MCFIIFFLDGVRFDMCVVDLRHGGTDSDIIMTVSGLGVGLVRMTP